VEPDAEARVLARQLDRLVKSLTGHHQAGVGQDPFAVSPDNAGVDARRHPEVVGGDDETRTIHGNRGYGVSL
jgi:hypothetical protein